MEFQSSAAILEYNVAMTIMTSSATSSSRQLMASNAKKLLPGFKDTLADPNSKHRYQEKLKLINDIDPYETLREDWTDDVDLWPCTSYINVGMYLLFSPSPYTQEDLENYKSLECYQRFLAGWVRDVLVKAVEDKRVVMAKDSHLFVS